MALLANSINSLMSARDADSAVGASLHLRLAAGKRKLPLAWIEIPEEGAPRAHVPSPVISNGAGRLFFATSLLRRSARAVRNLSSMRAWPLRQTCLTHSGQESTALAVLKTRNFRRRGLNPRVGALYEQG